MHFNTNQFTYEGKMFVAEASTLGFSPEAMDRVYADACDVGFTLVSAKTGDEVKFVYHTMETDYEGDVVAFIFHPDQYAVARNSKLEGVVLHILND